MNKKITEIQEITYYGRTAVKDGAVSLFWTASGIRCVLKASSLQIEVEALYGGLELWADVLIDGELSQRICLPRGRSVIRIFSGMDPSRQRTVKLLRDTQAMAQDGVSVLRILNIETDDNAEFIRPADPALRLEFIGDSITSGEGAGLEKQVEWVPAVFSAIHSYGYLTAEKLNASYSILSSSGWGLYASWDAHTECALPLYYDGVCSLAGSDEDRTYGAQDPWDFSQAGPDCIIVNLGTNDSGALSFASPDNGGKPLWSREEYHGLFVETAVNFLKKLRDRNPEAYLLWAYGMLGNDMADWIREAVADYSNETGDKRVSYFEFTGCTEEYLGARFHPNRQAHVRAAGELSAQIQRVLGIA